MSKGTLVAARPRATSPKRFMHLVPLKPLNQIRGSTGHIACFLLEVTVLETVRRFSRAKCPFVWKAIQSLQVLCYPPFKWIHRWAPFRIVVDSVQKISRPLLVLSIATAFSDHSENCKHVVDNVDDSQPSDELSRTSNADISPVEATKHEPENWLLQLVRELDKQGVSLPERINEDELQRFYDAANGDFSLLILSVKKTIRWRETYNILSFQELEIWSHLVFWHGFDVMLRPCLVIRLGLACSSLVPHDRPRFAQAVVSQIEHGVLHLINEEDPRITVLMDCEGISPFRFPMQVMRSCSTLVQNHYPNRLASLFVVRLPPVVRVLAQTLIQVLKPRTRQKLHVVGEPYQKVLSEFLQSVPEFLGGSCNCSDCERLHAGKLLKRVVESSMSHPCGNCSDDETVGDEHHVGDCQYALNGSCDHVLRAAIVSLLMLWIIVAFLAGMHDPESPSFLSS